MSNSRENKNTEFTFATSDRRSASDFNADEIKNSKIILTKMLEEIKETLTLIRQSVQDKEDLEIYFDDPKYGRDEGIKKEVFRTITNFIRSNPEFKSNSDKHYIRADFSFIRKELINYCQEQRKLIEKELEKQNAQDNKSAHETEPAIFWIRCLLSTDLDEVRKSAKNGENWQAYFDANIKNSNLLVKSRIDSLIENNSTKFSANWSEVRTELVKYIKEEREKINVEVEALKNQNSNTAHAKSTMFSPKKAYNDDKDVGLIKKITEHFKL